MYQKQPLAEWEYLFPYSRAPHTDAPSIVSGSFEALSKKKTSVGEMSRDKFSSAGADPRGTLGVMRDTSVIECPGTV
jgi:hypothetical protein